MLSHTLKSCPKCNKSPNMVILEQTYFCQVLFYSRNKNFFLTISGDQENSRQWPWSKSFTFQGCQIFIKSNQRLISVCKRGLFCWKIGGGVRSCLAILIHLLITLAPICVSARNTILVRYDLIFNINFLLTCQFSVTRKNCQISI